MHVPTVTSRFVLPFVLLFALTPSLEGRDRNGTSAAPARRELVVVVDSLPDWRTLAESRPPGSELLVIDGRADGLSQLAAHLRGRRDLDAIHVLSHGNPGSIRLGSTLLDGATVDQQAEALASIGRSLTARGDLLLYGCDVASTNDGQDFLARLAKATGADVAASTDVTGATRVGGNWRLESATGSIDRAAEFTAPWYAHALYTLNPGDIVVVGWSALSDTIRLATLVDIPSGTVIKITDKGWDRATNAFTTLETGDGTVTWTTSSAVSAGTVLSLYMGGSDATTTLTDVTRGVDISADITTTTYTVPDPMTTAGDGVFIYQDTEANPYFIFGFNNSAAPSDASNWNTSISHGLRDSMLPNATGSQNGLTNGVNAVGMPGGLSHLDNVQYTGLTAGADRATWLARVVNVLNWAGDLDGTETGSIGTSLSFVTNTAPTITNLSGDSVSYVEGVLAVTLDAGLNAIVTDVDSANFDGGNVTVSIVSNRVAGEDVLSIANQGPGVGQIGVSGSNVTFGGVLIGTAAGGSGVNDLVVTFNANATPAAAQALVRALTYANTNTTAPTTLVRSVRVRVSDGDGGTSSDAVISVPVVGVNDAPTLSATGAAATFTENGSSVDLFSGVSVSAVEPGQSITHLLLSLTNVADGSHEKLIVDGTTLDLVNGAFAMTAGNSLAASVSVVGTSASVTLSSALGIAPATMQTVVDALAYANHSDTPSTMPRVVTLLQLRDNGGTANGGVDTTTLAVATIVSVVSTNDVPTVTTSGGTAAFVEAEGASSTPIVIDGGLTVTDPDNSTLASAHVFVGGGYQSTEDVLSFVNNGLTMGNIAASYDMATGVMTLTSAGATATLAQWQAALRSVTYTNTSDAPNTSNRVIAFRVNDGQFDSSSAYRQVTVTSVNDSPVVTAPTTIAVPEDTATALTGISVSDDDAGSSSVTMTLSVPSGSLSAISGGGVTVGGTRWRCSSRARSPTSIPSWPAPTSRSRRPPTRRRTSSSRSA